MIAIHLEPEEEQLLEKLAGKAGCPVSDFAKEALVEHLEDMADYALAVEAFKDPGNILTPSEAKDELGL